MSVKFQPPATWLDGVLYRLSHAQNGQKHRITARAAAAAGVRPGTLERHLRRRRRERGLFGPLKPGDVPRPDRAAAGSVPPVAAAFMPDEQAVLDVLSALNGLSACEIARRTGLDPHRVRWLLSRLISYTYVTPALERICTACLGTRPTFKRCW